MNIGISFVAAEYVSSANSGISGKVRNEGLVEAQDEARLGEGMSSIRRLKQALSSVPELRKERIQELRSILAEGRYSVSPKDIAESLMTDMLGRSGLA